MTPLQRYVRRVADRLNLKDWAITVERNPIADDDTIFADITEAQGCNATMRVSTAFYEMSRQAQRETILHELCHLHTARLRSIATQLATASKNPLSNAVELIITDADEQIVETFAKVLAPLVPLPPKLKAPKVTH